MARNDPIDHMDADQTRTRGQIVPFDEMVGQLSSPLLNGRININCERLMRPFSFDVVSSSNEAVQSGGSATIALWDSNQEYGHIAFFHPLIAAIASIISIKGISILLYIFASGE
jgi:hypothetical protein